MSERTGRAIIIIEDQIVTIKRTKYKDGKVEKEYYTFPGGHVELGESYEEATIREIEEELGIQVELVKEFVSIYNKDLGRDERFFIARKIGGILGTGQGPEFTCCDYEKYGKYEVVQIKIEDIKNYTLYPLEVRDKVFEERKSF